jgi:hypothetical protein
MSKNIELSHEELLKILEYDPDTGIFTWTGLRSGTKSGKIAGTLSSDGYWQIQISGKIYRSHRLAWFYVYKKWPEGMLDHIDRDTLNASINNLRESSPTDNQRNRKVNKNSSTGVKGVSFNANSGKYEAYIKINYTKKHLGLFSSIEEAQLAQQMAETEVYDKHEKSSID